ncbi:hypothetical protein [Olivibacter domesticus]|uniref:Class IIb bacteriocin, lactobin A/cerein 7B family n=1 Tax=Olivibacter domesticus TaxID=407022 RepID=A0A1H7USZ4_OLID1|nr:hypothetical protein [Olivibacter domesticus]SEM00102.1 hypothetical protein SAMN05661044_03932 [Olivibacter domesticus]
MEALSLDLNKIGLTELSIEEREEVQGGLILAPFLAIGAAAAAGVAIYEAGKATGEFIYYVTH